MTWFTRTPRSRPKVSFDIYIEGNRIVMEVADLPRQYLRADVAREVAAELLAGADMLDRKAIR